ncbi:uncharacterized protein LOC133331730 [Musca vetustissima]|uniref:uncharacterized protein LOC133331730 n=1 Tax=Musca vetustissima TaxID=27455 RepID=UPI002AB7B017|nr:uncharacterized protein LOC133331730 [Musca vetustissima]
MMELERADNIDNILNDHFDYIKTKMSEFQERDSGWALLKVFSLKININKHSPIRGSQYIPTPKELKNKRACINIYNGDIYCFKWCLIAALETSQPLNPSKCSSYAIDNINSSIITLQNGLTLNFEGIEFPMELKYIKLFEEKNPNISVNVFGYEYSSKSVVGPYYITKQEKDKHVNLLLLENDGKSHYILIKSLSRLVNNQLTNCRRRLHICNQCLYYTSKYDFMERHRDLCSKVIAKMPEEGKSTLSFKNFHKQMNVPFVIYADFECVLKKVDNLDMVINKHLPCAFSFNVKCNFDSNLDELFIYTGRDAAEKFVEMLNSKCREIFNTYLSVKKPMTPLTPSQILEFENAKICHICDKELGSDKVHDHCHITGRYRGAAHKECNINYTVPTFIPILFHNFSGYDCHLFIKELIKYIPSKKTNIIPQNKELYISVSHVVDMGNGRELEYRFLDSFRFMAASLETLANNLEDADLKSVRAHFPIDNQFNLMRRKGIFCYEYLDSFDKLNDTILPPIEKFYSNLYNTSCSIDDYEHAKRVWETFNCQSLKDYMELYLKTDVLLLTDVFENFRKSCKRVHKLDPCQYYTAPGLSFDAMLRFTKITLDLLRDLNMFNVIKKGIRGGLVQCTKRLAKANNKYMKDYDKNSPSHYLLYLDANNLYGWAMKQYLPEGDFKWLQPEEAITDVEEILKFMHNSTIGYIYVVDLEYPEELHDLHNDLPFCAENKKVGDSKYEKLIADFSPKKNYAIHYMVLKQCLENGLKLAKVHFVISFRQSPWLAPYIDKNTSERQKASNSFLKDLYKLYNNSVFGKTMENVDKRKNIKLIIGIIEIDVE